MKAPIKGEYGRLLRAERERFGWSLRHLAEVLGYSAPFVSDVETGRRAPLRTSVTMDIARQLHFDPIPLLIAAAVDRGHVDIPLPASHQARAVLITLQVVASTVTPRQWERLWETLGQAKG